MEWLALLMFLAVIAVLMSGYPVALTLGGMALLFAALGSLLGGFEPVLLGSFSSRLFGIMLNET
ncbi:MAG: C4-dicarboxylate ABC transporter, partial [Gammaproteobacteria bacterium]|nr:C4-dicarboxylate ABC transporter [Gammaproteobacteria bacterium]